MTGRLANEPEETQVPNGIAERINKSKDSTVDSNETPEIVMGRIEKGNKEIRVQISNGVNENLNTAGKSELCTNDSCEPNDVSESLTSTTESKLETNETISANSHTCIKSETPDTERDSGIEENAVHHLPIDAQVITNICPNNIDVRVDRGDENSEQELDTVDSCRTCYDEQDGKHVDVATTQNLHFTARKNKDTEVKLDGLLSPDGQIRKHSVHTLSSPPILGVHAVDADTSADSSEDSVCQDERDTCHDGDSITRVKVEKRKDATLQINCNVDLCEIETVSYNCRASSGWGRDQLTRRLGLGGAKGVVKQHYIRAITSEVKGDILLEPLDEVIEVNGKELVNKSQRYVLDTFRKIRLKKEDDTLKLTLDLKVRRWVKDPASPEEDPIWIKVRLIEITLVLGPTPEEYRSAHEPGTARFLPAIQKIISRKRHQTFARQLSVIDKSHKKVEEDDLPKGNIRIDPDGVGSHYTAWIKISASGESLYINCDSDGLLSSAALQAKFTVEPFHGTDLGPKPVSRVVFGDRICFKKNQQRWFLTYKGDDEDVFCDLGKDDPISTNNIDARCFIIRKRGNRTLLQSAIDRDRFVYYDKDSKQFKMKYIDSAELVKLENSDPSALSKFDGCWFDVQPADHASSRRKMTSLLQLFSCGLFRRLPEQRQRRPHDFRSSRSSSTSSSGSRSSHSSSDG